MQKGKKKVEEAAAKAKDAVTSNGHAEDDAKSNGTPANDDDAHEHAQAGASDDTPHDAAAADTQPAQPAGETAVH